MIKHLVTISLLTVTALAVQGQGRFREPLQASEVVVSSRVSVKDAALTESIIDSSQMSQSSHQTLSELLSRNTPIFIKSYGLGSTATVSFRGTAASHTAVEWNGLNINNPMLGQVDFAMLPVWLVDRASLLHGGSSLREGGGALGGSVILSSLPRRDKPFYGSAMAGMGSFGLWQAMAQVGGGNEKVRVDARYLYEQARNDFEFKNTAIPPFDYMKQQNANYRKQAATLDLSVTLGKGHYLDLNSWFQTAWRNLPAIMSYEGRGRDEHQTDDELRGVLRWRWYGKGLRSVLTAGATTTNLNYYLESKTDMGSLVNYDSRSQANTFQTKYTLDWDITSRTLLRILLNAQYSDVNTLDRKTDTGYSANRFDLGLSASVHHRFSSLLSGYLLARWENPSAFIPSLGLELEPLRNFRIRLNATRNYHRPTLNDLYWLPGGNPDLRPEKGISADLGVKYNYTKKRWSFEGEVTGYISRIDDWIMWQPGEYRYWTPSNIKTVLARGAEVTIGGGYRTRDLSVTLRLNYAFTRTTNQQATDDDDESYGKQLIYIPLNKANALLDVSWRFLYAYYNWSFIGERYTTTSNEVSMHALPQYTLSDICVGARLYGVDVAFKVNNLFDKDYQAILWRPMPKRNFNLLIKYTF